MINRIEEYDADDFSEDDCSECFYYNADGSRLADEDVMLHEIQQELDLQYDSESSSIFGHFAWSGREADADEILHYNRARHYDPTTGRWLASDPLAFDASEINLHRYAGALNGSDGETKVMS